MAAPKLGLFCLERRGFKLSGLFGICGESAFPRVLADLFPGFQVSLGLMLVRKHPQIAVDLVIIIHHNNWGP